MQPIETFDFLTNLPLIIFSLGFFVVFVIFLFGGFILLSARGEVQELERGRRIVLNSLYSLFVILLIVLVFFTVSYLLKKGEVFKPKPASGEFPVSPVGSFPPAPQFIEIGGYYFEGPWSLEMLSKQKVAPSPDVYGLYAILCKKNGEYDIINIGETDKEQVQYDCWLENCNQKVENLYIALLHADDKNKIIEYLNNKVNPPCNL